MRSADRCTTSFPGRRRKSNGRRPGRAIVLRKRTVVRPPFQVVVRSPTDDGPEGPSYSESGPLYDVLSRSSPAVQRTTARKGHRTPKADRCTTSFLGRRRQSNGRRPGRAIVLRKRTVVRRPFQVVVGSPADDGPEGPSYSESGPLYDVLSRSSPEVQRTTARKGHRTPKADRCTTSFPGRRRQSNGRRPGRDVVPGKRTVVRRPFQVVVRSPTDDGPEGPSYSEKLEASRPTANHTRQRIAIGVSINASAVRGSWAAPSSRS
ncbi:hypothetical protein Enr13x_46150 [Stieleria neptunia]|uniref:Uncharacterized protein n=1 Tax=Stieleria neptunia TaxID=2527979 RepID=A0A518HV68_9BACT|nr:hypothetical protein Enr13x_46150 [Stieleria neptunia]